MFSQVYIKRPEKTVQLIVSMEVFVDLPASKKGSDLSRNSEVIEEVALGSPCICRLFS